jgi:hypothetical protein
MPRLEREGLSVDNMIPSRHSAKAQENAGVMTRAMRSSPRRTPQALQSGDARGAGDRRRHEPSASRLVDCTSVKLYSSLN